MRRRPTPPPEYTQHDGYPSLAEARLSRRGFLGQAIAAAATAAGTVALGASPTEARKWRDTRTKVSIDLYGAGVFTGTDLRPEKVDLYVTDRRLASYLKKHYGDAKLRAALTKLLKGASKDALFDGRKLLRLEQRLGAAVTHHYRKATGRRARRPDVQLHVRDHYRLRALGAPIRGGAYRRIKIIRGLGPTP